MAAESFVGVRVAGGLLPAELLSRIAAGELAGQTSGDYHLAPGETVREAANRAWAYLTGVWATYRQAAEKLPESDRGTTLTRSSPKTSRATTARSAAGIARDVEFCVTTTWASCGSNASSTPR